MDYSKIVSDIGLPEKEAQVYGALLKLGEGGAKELLPLLSGIKRANLYALLASLQEKGIVTESEKPGKMRFRAETPEKLRDIVSTRLNRAKEAEGALERSLPLLVSQFNLASGKPTVQFLEGKDGLIRILKDSLTSETEILQYVGSDFVHKVIPKENAEYVAKRLALGIKKRYITPDNAILREEAKQHTELTEARVIAPRDNPFSTIMMIYDKKISYVTLSLEHMIGIIIHDPKIYEMHRDIFEELWKHAERVGVKPSSLDSSPNLDTQAEQK